MTQKVDYSGRRFGKLTAIQPGNGKVIGKKKAIHKTTWFCQCDCGKTVEVLTCNLKRTGTQSCGCAVRETIKYNWVDLTGKKFGKLTVIRKTDKYTKTRGTIWECRCDCGNVIELPSNSLTSGNNITCSKKNEFHQQKYIEYGEIPVSHITHIKNNATKRNLLYNVSADYLWDLFLKQDRKCALSHIEIYFTDNVNISFGKSENNTTASLDRINSSKGYIEGNVQWVHKTVNKMKSNMEDDEFREWCRLCFMAQYGLNNRPSWDEYFLMLSFDVARRSEDPDIHHGAIIVNNNYIIGTGYNATIKASDKTKIPLNIRDKKRPWFIHAEENAILNCHLNPNLTDSLTTIYVTGLPCCPCLQRVINFGIKRIVYADRSGTITENEQSAIMREQIISMSNIEIIKFDCSNKWIRKSLY
jgi:deoxycytidylate deaminase